MAFNYQKIVARISELLLERYVDLDAAETMSAHLTENLSDYSEIEDGPMLAKRLTDDLRVIAHDKHVTVLYQPEKAAILLTASPEDDIPESWVANAMADNYGFYRVEWLKGGIGYIDLRRFAPPEVGGDIAVATMNFLGNAKAIIFDLRQNYGGSPNMVQLLTTYLFEGNIRHLNTFYTRYKDEYTHFWTLPHVPGKRLPNAHVYVLTSGKTFSGAEEFAYNLKAMERATLIGETTAGGAHPGDTVAVSGHFTIFVPDGRAINPITHSNWEGVGVMPHIETPAEAAFSAAHKLALATLLEETQEATEKALLESELEVYQNVEG